MNRYRLLLVFIIVACLLPGSLRAASDKEWRDAWNRAYARGKAGESVPHGWVDILTGEYAVAVCRVSRFYLGLGRALHGAYATGRQPGLALYIDDSSDTGDRYLYVKRLAGQLNIRVWLMNTTVNPNPGGVLMTEPVPVVDSTAPVLEPCTLIWVTDGDTIKVKWRGAEVFVRMLRINTPEKKAFGYKKATETLRALLLDRELFLEFENPDNPATDRFKRLLAYVHAAGRVINVDMVRSGWTKYWTRFGVGKYDREFRAAEAAAQKARQGLWNK